MMKISLSCKATSFGSSFEPLPSLFFPIVQDEVVKGSEQLFVTFQQLHRPPLWIRGNVVASYPADSGSIPGRVNFLVEVFSGFSLNRKTNVRKFGPHSSPVIIWPPHIIQTIYHPSTDGDATVSDHSCST